MRERWLGGLSTREFLRPHWQKRPLLARAGWSAPAGLPDAARLFSLALRVTRRIRWTERDVQRLLGRYLTLPKPLVTFRPPRRPLPRAAFLRRLARSDVALDARSMLLYRGARFFLNGEDFVPCAGQRGPLAALADRRRAAGAALARAGLGDRLYAWYRSGCLRLELRT